MSAILDKIIEEARALSPEELQQLREFLERGLLNADKEHGTVLAPESTDSKERDLLLRSVLPNMRLNPLPVGAPCFTRDELHERS
jgi:hypothetical protein